MQLDAAAQIALITYPVVVAVLGGFVRSAYNDLKKQVEGEVLARGAALVSMRQEMQRVEERVNGLQREIDKDYVNYDRLTHALRPINDTLVEIKREQERLFERLEGKADKDDHPLRRRMDPST